MSDIKAEWTNKDNFSIETTASDYIKREDAIEAVKKHPDENYDLKQSERDGLIMSGIDNLPSADVVEVGKAYLREEFEKYGLSEWKDKHGQRWVMIERKIK